MLIFDETGRPWTLGAELSAGGEGRVCKIIESNDFCAKIYHTLPLPPLKQEKLAALRAMPSSARRNAALPVSLAFAQQSRKEPNSVILPFVQGHDIYELYNPQGRRAHFRSATFEFLVAAAKNLAAAFHDLHAHGIVVGDVNEKNIQVREDATLSLIDCDSFQFTREGRVFTSDVGTPLWTPPELQGASMHALVRTRNHDHFGLAQLVFLLLFAGRYPFAGRPLTPAQLGPEEAIRRYAFAFDPAPKTRLLGPPSGAPPLEALPPQLCLLFIRAFREGSAGPAARPTAEEWAEALHMLSRNLKQCAMRPGHVYWSGAAACPWCSVLESARIDLFPTLPQHAGGVGAMGREHLRAASHLVGLAFVPLRLAEPSAEELAQHIAAACPPAKRTFNLNVTFSFFGLRQQHQAKKAAQLKSERDTLHRRLRAMQAQASELTQRARTQAELILKEARKLGAALRDSASIRAAALATVRDKEREAALQRHLEGRLLRRQTIAGIGESRRALLLSNGIVTAADVSEEAILLIPTFGRALAERLIAWRKECEGRFVFATCANSPTTESIRLDMERLVRERYSELLLRGTSVEASLQRLQTLYAKELAALQAEFEQVCKMRAVLDSEITCL